jgi:hypothetical protein
MIQEWRKYTERPNSSELIYERQGHVRRVDFDRLLAEVKSGQTTHDEAALIFERAFDYGMKQLLEEGVLDILKKIPGVEKAAQLTGKVAEKVKAAWKRVSDFYLSFVLKAMQLGQQGIEKFSKYITPILKGIESFEKRHPLFYKMILAALVVLAVYALFGSSNAQAAVQVGDKALTTGEYKAAMGVLETTARMSDSTPQLKMQIMEAQAALQEAFKAKETINISTLGPMTERAGERKIRTSRRPSRRRTGRGVCECICKLAQTRGKN